MAGYRHMWVDGRVVREHRHIAELALGYELPPIHHVHHVDGDKKNNTNSNLVICEDHKYHMLLHLRTEAYKATGNPNLRRCSMCGEWKAMDQYHLMSNGWQRSRCKKCEDADVTAWRKKNRERYNQYHRDRRRSKKEVLKCQHNHTLQNANPNVDYLGLPQSIVTLAGERTA